jgi:hypothetical protein
MRASTRMRIASVILIGLAAPLLAVVANAQSQDDIGIIRAAVTYALREQTPRTLIVDGTRLLGDSASVSRLAGQLGGSTGRLADHLRCEADDPVVPRCSLGRDTVVVELWRPTITADSAETSVSWSWEVAPGRIATRSLKLALFRTAESGWRVTNVLMSGRS